MKHFFTFFILAVITLTSYSQTRQRFDRKVDSMLSINRQNNYHLDTLWVLDSSVHFRDILHHDDIDYERTYKVLSRNEQGNLLSALDWANQYLMIYTDNSTYDSVIYFDGVHVKKHVTNVWNSFESTWISDGYEEYESPELLKIKSFKGFSDIGQTYRNGYRKEYDNSNGHLDTLFTYTYDQESDSWLADEKQSLFCDGQSNDTLVITYEWAAGSWEAISKTRIFFENNLSVGYISYTYDTISNNWKNLRLGIYTYNNQGLQDTITIKYWSTENNSWYESFQLIYTYDDQCRITNTLMLAFNSTMQGLKNVENCHTDYLEGSTTTICEVWDIFSESWVFRDREYTSYIADDLVDTLRFDLWNSGEQQWQPDELSVNKFDSRMNVVESATYGFGFLGMHQATRIDYFWSPFIPNAIPEIQSSALVVYPNPASTQVSFSLPNVLPFQNQNGVVQLYNLSGQKITEMVLTEGSAVWDCSDVKPGLYVYVALNGDSSLTGKIVVGN